MAFLERSPERVYALEDLQIFASFADDPKIGKGGSFGHEWGTVGILTEDGKIAIQKAMDKDKVKGAGFGNVSTRLKPGDLTVQGEVLEENMITYEIAWPDRVNNKGVDVLRHSSKAARPFIAIVFVRDNGEIEILASRQRTIATMEDVGRGMSVEGKTVMFDIEPGADKGVFDHWIVGASDQEEEMSIKQLRFVDEGDVEMNSPKSFKAVLGSPTGGTFDVYAGPKKVTGIAHDANASAIQKALRAAGDEDAEVTGDASAGFVFKKVNGPVSVDAAKLTGGGYPKKVAVTEES